jgi:hypothetical protein
MLGKVCSKSTVRRRTDVRYFISRKLLSAEEIIYSPVDDPLRYRVFRSIS